jgi:ACS family allantoate permease-like MFS transporter
MAAEKEASPDYPEMQIQTTTNNDVEGGPTKKLSEADPALQFTDAEVVEFTEEEERSVLSKIDWHILPLLCWVYMVQFADKTTLNYASLMGIRTDTHLDPNSDQYSWASSIFYAGYIAWE